MTAEDLIQVARWLADDDKTGRAKGAFRARSISTAYYALFHALAGLCADELVGAAGDSAHEWQMVYRALDHSAARRVLVDMARSSESERLGSLAATFDDLQSLRHRADYERSATFSAQEAMSWVDAAARAIWIVSQLSGESRKALAVRLLFKQRSDRGHGPRPR